MSTNQLNPCNPQPTEVGSLLKGIAAEETAKANRRAELELLEEIKGERDPIIERCGYNNSGQRPSSWWRSNVQRKSPGI